MAAEGVADELIDSVRTTFDYVVGRLSSRLEGLDDAEFFWEPVPGCWSVREVATGCWTMDGGEKVPGPPPFTTIAWRLDHLACHVLGGFATWLRDGGSPYGDPEAAPPHSAAAALDALSRHWDRWRDGMALVSPARWAEPIGPAFGEHAEASTAALVLHVLDEVVHHAAEIGVVRDLYRASR